MTHLPVASDTTGVFSPSSPSCSPSRHRCKRCRQPHRTRERASFPFSRLSASVRSYPKPSQKEPEMTVHSHTPTSLLKRIKAMHHGTAATTTTTTTVAMTATHHHDHRSSEATSTAGHSRAVLLGVLLVAQLMVILDITAVNIALPSLARDLQLSGADGQLDDHELLARLRQPAPLRRPPVRPRRAPAHVPDRPRNLHRLLGRLRRRGHRGGIVRSTRRPGPRSRPALTGRPLDHHERVPRQGAGEGARSLGRSRRRRRGDWRPRRRRPHRGRRLAPHLLRQHPGRDRARSRRPERHPA